MLLIIGYVGSTATTIESSLNKFRGISFDSKISFNKRLVLPLGRDIISFEWSLFLKLLLHSSTFLAVGPPATKTVCRQCALAVYSTFPTHGMLDGCLYLKTLHLLDIHLFISAR